MKPEEEEYLEEKIPNKAMYQKVMMMEDGMEAKKASISVFRVMKTSIIWEIEDVQALLTDGGEGSDASITLHGFVNLIAPIPPFALFSTSEDVFLVDTDDNSVAFRTLAPSPSVLSGVVDVTGDGLVDLIISLPETETVQIYYLGQARARP